MDYIIKKNVSKLGVNEMRNGSGRNKYDQNTMYDILNNIFPEKKSIGKQTIKMKIYKGLITVPYE